jgi:hypothetical protein
MACRKCGVLLDEENRVEYGRRLCKSCRNDASRAKYVKRVRCGRRGWIAPTRSGDKKQARRRINYLVEQGLIERPNDLPCFDCGDVFAGTCRHEYDHARGYGWENQLYVEPVCSRCHHRREEARRGFAV